MRCQINKKNKEVKTDCIIYFGTSHWNFSSFGHYGYICLSEVEVDREFIDLFLSFLHLDFLFFVPLNKKTYTDCSRLFFLLFKHTSLLILKFTCIFNEFRFIFQRLFFATISATKNKCNSLKISFSGRKMYQTLFIFSLRLTV